MDQKFYEGPEYLIQSSISYSQRNEDFRTLGKPIFTYDELEIELRNAQKKILELESAVFKLQNENKKLKEIIEISSKISEVVKTSTTY